MSQPHPPAVGAAQAGAAGSATRVPLEDLDVAELMAALDSGPDGLSGARAQARLLEVGPNSVEDARARGPLGQLLGQFRSPLVLILVFAAAVSLFLRQWVDASIILVIVVGSSLLGFSQEYRASKAVAELTSRLALTSRVVRDGVERTVPSATIVPGDVVVLSAGNLIPADARLLDARDFLVSEASLTGESSPVEKRPGPVAAGAPLAARTDTVFLGASVRSGTARAIVVRTGRATAFGAIVARLRSRPPATDFARGLEGFGYVLVRAMVVIVLFVLTVNLALHRPLVESLLFSVALAVGLSPELLPAIVSVTLSAGAREMSRNGVIVRRLEAIENFGSMDVLCTDKTGTLTEGVIELEAAHDAAGRACGRVALLAFVNASLETGIDNPLDDAIVTAGERAGLSTSPFVKIDEIPYDFQRKRLTIVVAEAGDATRHLLITKGAFSTVLEGCTHVERDGAVVALTDALRAELAERFRADGEAGFRVLAIATRELPARAEHHREDEAGMTFVGCLRFLDPPKPDAARILADLAARDVRIKVVTGDNRFVTAHVAQSVGLDRGALLTGEELARLSDDALPQVAERTSLFVEIDPQQKERIVRALQRAGHAVGYMGDGINDAPALHAADVGVSVESAVDVARESADIILLRRDLDVLRTGVEGGRRTFANTLKYISITTSANFGNMVSMALAAPLLPFLPLAAKQILLNNFLSDVPSIAISTDRVDPERVASPQRWDLREVRRFMVVFGLVSSAFDLLTFAALLLAFHVDEPTFQTSWFVVSLLTELGVVLLLRTRGPAWRSRPSGLLLSTTVAATVLALALPYLGAVSALFGFVALSAGELGVAVAIVVAYLAATEAAKRRFFRGARVPAPGRGA